MAQEFEWGSDDLDNATTREENWYKCLSAGRDYVRVIHKKVYLVKVHDFKQGETYHGRVMCSSDKYGECPICDKYSKKLGQHTTQRWATVILHVARIPKGAKSPIFVGKVLAWRFSDRIKSDIQELASEAGGGAAIRQRDLILRVEEGNPMNEQFQNLKISMCPRGEGAWDKLSQEKKSALVKLAKKALSEREACYFPTPDDVQAQYDNIAGKAEGADDDEELELDDGDVDFLDVEEEEEEKPKKKVKKKAKKKSPPPEDDFEVEDEEEEDDTEEESFDFDEDDPLAGIAP